MNNDYNASLTDYEYTVLRLKQTDMIRYVEKLLSTAKGRKELFNLHHDGRIPHYDYTTKRMSPKIDFQTDEFFSEKEHLEFFATFFKDFKEFLLAIKTVQGKTENKNATIKTYTVCYRTKSGYSYAQDLESTSERDAWEKVEKQMRCSSSFDRVFLCFPKI